MVVYNKLRQAVNSTIFEFSNLNYTAKTLQEESQTKTLKFVSLNEGPETR